MKITFKLYASLTDYLPAASRTSNRVELDLAEGTAIAHDLMARLGVQPDQLLEGAYLDLLRLQGDTGR